MSEVKRKKYGGRKAGTPNKDTKELRERITELIDNNFDSIQADLEALPPEKRLDFLVKLFEYALPKLNRTEFEAIVETSESDNTQPKTLADWYDANRSNKVV